MPKVKAPSDFGDINNPADFQRVVAQYINELSIYVNGKLEFDSNIRSQTIEVSFNAGDTDTAVTHSLNRTGLNFITVNKSQTCDVYLGQTTATKSTIYLRCTQVTTVTVVLY